MRVRGGRRKWLVALTVFMAVFLFTFLTAKFKNNIDVEAANLANFDPGYIISDYQMGNYNSMSEAEIWNFLKQKGNCNDTRIWQTGNNLGYLSESAPYSWHVSDGHYVCLADENFSGESAAHIIWQAAQDYRINPQVLIVLLQKEQGLITDSFPNSVQYRSATGYGCPDTAACSSRYYGFKNQVRNAAALFRTVLDGGWTNYPLGNNYIQYNPNSGCGGSWVNIRSLATSALYRYTPYQPNASALAAGYGSGDSCGAYGNRNFYSYFEDWFGGITENAVSMEEMVSPRVMTINKSTLVIDAKKLETISEWLNNNENYYFTKKISVFWNGEKQTCLQRRIDEGTDRCVLMARLSEFSLDESAVIFPEVRKYEIKQWTCAVDLYNQSARCDIGAYPKGNVLSASKIVVIDGKEYLIEGEQNNNYAILRMRTERKLDYEVIGPVVMKLLKGSYKYIDGEETRKVQTVNVSTTPIIKIMEKVNIDGNMFYRTFVDYKNNNNYVIPASVLSNEVFDDFIFPRNMKTKQNVSSIDLDSGNRCSEYRAGDIKRYLHKVSYAGVLYYQNKVESGTKCVVRASDLEETEYNFENKNIESMFVDFLIPRKLRVNNGVYTIDLRDGTTCNEYLSSGDIQRYTTKTSVGNLVFYRTENNTRKNSTCAMPSSALSEI